MNAGPDPEQARRALSVAAEQRRKATEAADRTPGWIWPAAFVLVSAVWAAGDLGREGRSIALVALLLLLLAAASLLRSSPRLAESLGLEVQLHRSATPARSRAALLAVFAVLVPLGFFGPALSRALVEAVGAPAWAAIHPNTVVGVLLAGLVSAGGYTYHRVRAGRR